MQTPWQYAPESGRATKLSEKGRELQMTDPLLDGGVLNQV